MKLQAQFLDYQVGTFFFFKNKKKLTFVSKEFRKAKMLDK